jgi:hypothetical protein
MPESTTERPILAMFIGPHGAEILYDDEPAPPPPPSRQDELRAALEHLRQAIAALRRAIRTA